MRRSVKNGYGITLIETMLVMSIAALVVVMSVRYFYTAQNSSQANSYVAQIQQYIVSGSSIYQNTGAFPTRTTMEAMLPNGANAWRLPWGATGSYTPETMPTAGFVFTHARPSAATCTLIRAKFASNPKISIVGNCAGLQYMVTR